MADLLSEEEYKECVLAVVNIVNGNHTLNASEEDGVIEEINNLIFLARKQQHNI